MWFFFLVFNAVRWRKWEVSNFFFVIFIFNLLFFLNRFLTNSFERFYEFSEHVVNGVGFPFRDLHIRFYEFTDKNIIGR